MWNQPDWREGVSLGSHGEEIFFLLMCLGFHLTLGIPSFNHIWKSGLNTQVDALQKNIFLASLTLCLILRVRGKKISLYSNKKKFHEPNDLWRSRRWRCIQQWSTLFEGSYLSHASFAWQQRIMTLYILMDKEDFGVPKQSWNTLQSFMC